MSGAPRLGPIDAVRRSFRWKLLLALIASVAVLALVTLAVVRRETRQQIEMATEMAEARSQEAFLDLETQNQVELGTLAAVFTGSRQVLAALEAALESGDRTTLRQIVVYELELRGFAEQDALVSFTDAYGEPVLTMLGGEEVIGDDPAGVGAAAERILFEGEDDIGGYRLVGGGLYAVETVLLQLRFPVGTATFGVRLGEAQVARLGSVLGAEVCFIMQGRCVVGTAAAEPAVREAMAELAMSPRSASEPAEIAGERWRLLSGRFAQEEDSARWAIALPLAPVEGPFRRLQAVVLGAALGSLLLAGLLATVLSRSMTRPIHALVDATSRVGGGDFEARVEVSSDDEIGVLGRAFNEMARGLALKERYRGVLDKVVSKEIADELLKGDVMLGGEKREVTVVFADITDFTRLTDGMEPPEVIGMLNECMERLTGVVEAAGGVVDKYVGDEIMAVFGAPVSRGDDALRGVKAALAMQAEMRALNLERAARGKPPLEISTGVNSGIAMAGNMGSPNRLNYTVLGDTVNLAGRVERRAESGQVLMTEHTLARVEGRVRTRDLGPARLRGFAQEVRLYELLEVLPEEAVEEDPPEDGGTGEPGARGAAPQGAALGLALLLAGAWSVVGGAGPLHAQGIGELPTLERLYFSSASGAFQLGFSGRLDVEGYLPEDDPAWIIPATEPFLAPRLRLFADAFLGERLLATAELRVDRGEEPADAGLEVRFDQAFVRFVPEARLAVQVGKFASPFAGYPQRHHTVADPLIRPPLPYDHRTVLGARRAPESPLALLIWKDSPEVHRPGGAPVIWGAPYQWGGIVMVSEGRFSARAALMNSAPSSEPEEWGLSRGFGAPSFVANVGAQVLPALRLELSYDDGPWMEEDATGLPAGTTPEDYDQRIWGAEAIFSLGGTKVRGEIFHDTWGVPNVGYGVVDVSWYVEAEQDVRSGLTVAARWGAVRFLELEGTFDAADPQYRAEYAAPWDYDVSRLQLGAGYRLARNAGVRAEATFNRSDGPFRVANDLGALQLWWTF